MEIENIQESDDIYKKTVFILLLMFVLVVFFIICLITIVGIQSEYIFRLLLVITTTALFGVGFILLGTTFIVVLLWHGHPVTWIPAGLSKLSLVIIYPGMLFLGKLLKYDKKFIRNIFIKLNNKSVLVNEYNMEGCNILILIPHCIQKSSCPHRITTNIENCRHCGKCKVDDLIRLKEEFGTNIRVVTGGTLARKVVKDLRPKAIVAIACERDLISGLYDVRNLPVIAIVNKRPEGPCVNTSVNVDEVRSAIGHFLGFANRT